MSVFLSHVRLAQCLVHGGCSKTICGINVCIYVCHIGKAKEANSKKKKIFFFATSLYRLKLPRFLVQESQSVYSSVRGAKY